MGYTNYKKRGLDFLGSHPEFNATIHALGGVAVGILIMYYFNLQSPLTWAIVLGAISLLGHLYAFLNGKK